jgi:hypothetical protein
MFVIYFTNMVCEFFHEQFVNLFTKTERQTMKPQVITLPRIAAIPSSHTMLALGLAAASAATPLVVGQSQVLTGTLVNCLLILAALNLRSWRQILPVIVLPSAALLLSGGAALGMMLLLPVIWSANALLVNFFRTQGSYSSALMAGAAMKTVLILGATAVLVAAGMLPLVFLEFIAPLQFLTAILGGLAALPANAAIRRFLM